MGLKEIKGRCTEWEKKGGLGEMPANFSHHPPSVILVMYSFLLIHDIVS